MFTDLKVYFFKGIPSMPDIMTLPGKLLIKRGTIAERMIKTLLT